MGGTSGFFPSVVRVGSPGSDRQPGDSLLSQQAGGHEGPTVGCNCQRDFPMGRSKFVGFEGSLSAGCSECEGGQAQQVSSIVGGFPFVKEGVQVDCAPIRVPLAGSVCLSRELPVATILLSDNASGGMGSGCSVGTVASGSFVCLSPDSPPPEGASEDSGGESSGCF